MLLLGHLAMSLALALPHASACGLGQSVGPLEGRDTLIATGPSDDGRYFFPRMASFAALATLNLTTRFAGIFISLPV